jgi:hypothetical protein
VQMISLMFIALPLRLVTASDAALAWAS